MPGGNPWAALKERDDVLFDLADLPAGEHGRWYAGERVILLAKGLTYAERRTALGHELGHAHFGDTCTGNAHVNSRQERAADIYAANMLIDIDDLISALRWSSDPWEIADDLQVTPRLVEIREARMHPGERAYLRRQLADQVEADDEP